MRILLFAKAESYTASAIPANGQDFVVYRFQMATLSNTLRSVPEGTSVYVGRGRLSNLSSTCFGFWSPISRRTLAKASGYLPGYLRPPCVGIRKPFTTFPTPALGSLRRHVCEESFQGSKLAEPGFVEHEGKVKSI